MFQNSNPSFKDINNNFVMGRGISLILLTVFFSVSTFILTSNLEIAIGIGLFTLFYFIVIFKDNFFSLKNFYSFHVKKFDRISPFGDLEFWQNKKDLETLYYTNKRDLLTVGIKVFKVVTMPENIRSALNHFIKSMYNKRLSYTYQIIQLPLIKYDTEKSLIKNRHRAIGSIKSFNTEIYFCVYNYVSGVLTNSKLDFLNRRLITYKNIMRGGFDANFHHFKFDLLSGYDLINALRNFVVKDEGFLTPEDNFTSSKTNIGTFLKSFSVIFVVTYSTFILVMLNIQIFYVALIDILILLIIFFLWWREMLFYFSKKNLRNNDDIVLLEPFKKMEFLRFRNIPDSLFIYYDKNLLIDLKAYNLKQVFNTSYVFPDKLFRASIGPQIPFTYTATMSPIGWTTFNKEAKDSLNKKTKKAILRTNEEFEGEQWCMARSGVWRTILNITISSHKFIEGIKNSHIIELEQKLQENFESWGNFFEMEFSGYFLNNLKNEHLISGFAISILKNKFIRISGTHLNYILFLGKSLVYLTLVIDELKKGIETRIAAEFNTPLQLENDIIVGDTINTEFLRAEIPFGFKEGQLNNLLVVNGKHQEREAICMKIVTELIKVDVPSLIFDFRGDWSKLIEYFSETRFKDKLLYFKLGSSFSVDPIRSGISYDKNNADYLNFFFDVFALAFKKNDQYINNLKSVILNNREMDLSTLELGLAQQANWDRNPITDSLLTILNDLSLKTVSLFNASNEDADQVGINDFIGSDKTVIIDLSSLGDDLQEKIFVSFMIVSKIIHFANYSDDYFNKIIILPNIDMFFNSSYLDMYGKVLYHKIDKFLNPLLENFGMIFTANQISYLHTNVFNYFNNIITFKATNKFDISILRNEMGLQEMQGKGFYSSTRKNTYQIEYLKQMNSDEILVKRSDIYQPFPAKFEINDLNTIEPLSQEKINGYMNEQGYDLKFSEEQLRARARQTIFEIDLGLYSRFIPEVIKLLEAIRTIELVGYVYMSKLEDELKAVITPKAVKLTNNNKKHIKKIRDNILSILINHEYLIESHPRMPGGRESIRPSYKVGHRFIEAVNDYYATQRDIGLNIEVIEKESVKPKEIKEQPKVKKNNMIDKMIKDTEFRSVLMKKISNYLLLNQMAFKRAIKGGNYAEALEIGKKYIPEFLVQMYTSSYKFKVENEITDNTVNNAIDFLTTSEDHKLPFTKEEIIAMIQKTKVGNITEGDLDKNLEDIYRLMAQFSLRVQGSLSKGALDIASEGQEESKLKLGVKEENEEEGDEGIGTV